MLGYAKSTSRFFVTSTFVYIINRIVTSKSFTFVFYQARKNVERCTDTIWTNDTERVSQIVLKLCWAEHSSDPFYSADNNNTTLRKEEFREISYPISLDFCLLSLYFQLYTSFHSSIHSSVRSKEWTIQGQMLKAFLLARHRMKWQKQIPTFPSRCFQSR